MPKPIDKPATTPAGTTDGNGNADIVSSIRAAYWSLVWAICTTSGDPDWVLGVNGVAKRFGTGPTAIMGPVLVPPNSQAYVQCIGGAATSSIGIDFEGWQSQTQDGSDLAPLAGSPITANSIPAVIQGGTVTVIQPQSSPTSPTLSIAPGTAGSQSWAIPNGAGTVIVEFISAGSSGSDAVDAASVGGFSSGSLYYNQPSMWMRMGTVLTIPLLELTDNFVMVSASCPPSNAQNVNVKVGFGPPGMATVIGNNGIGQPVPVAPPSVIFVQPFSVSTGAVATTHIVPAVATKTIYLRKINVEMSAAVSAAGNYQDTAANVIHHSTFQNNTPHTLDFDDYPLTAGNGAGLDFAVTAAVAGFVQGSVVYRLQ